MPRKISRAPKRNPVGLIVMSVFVIGSLAMSAIFSLIDVPVVTPTSSIFVTRITTTELAMTVQAANRATETATPTDTPEYSPAP